MEREEKEWVCVWQRERETEERDLKEMKELKEQKEFDKKDRKRRKAGVNRASCIDQRGTINRSMGEINQQISGLKPSEQQRVN